MGLLVTACLLYGISWWWLVLPSVLYLTLLVLGSVFIRWNFYLKAYHQGDRIKEIALTFDDGPAGETAAILDILKEQQVPATFFSIGKRAENQPELVRRWHEEGHLTGNHSYAHAWDFDWKSSHAMLSELHNTNEVLTGITGHTPICFRPPYGVTNPNLARAVRETGMHAVGWSVRSFDTTAKNPEVLLNRILGRLCGGDIILLHDSMPVTREILTELIIRARKKGFIFVRVDQLLDLPAYA